MTPPLPLQLYRLVSALAEPLAPRLLAARARRGKEDPARLDERLGHASRERPDGPLIWLHGASVGESLSILPLVERLRAKRPDLHMLMTSGTVAAAELIPRRAAGWVIHQYAPIDAPGAVARFLGHWRPNAAVLVESEIWPNLILSAKNRGVRLALVSARLSEASLTGWSRRPAAARAIFRSFDLVLSQTDDVARGLRALGARDHGRLNLKLAGAPLGADADRLAELRCAAGDRPVMLAASTHPGEDEIVLDAFQPIAGYGLLVIVPRHIGRGPDIAAAARARGFEVALRSEAGFGDTRVYVADTLGELGLWFSLSAAVLIGGSLLPGPGGHNPIEPAQLGCPIVTGPHVENWREVYAALIGAGAAVVASDALELTAAFAEVLARPAAAHERAERARQLVSSGEAGLDSAVQSILKLI